MTQDNNDPLAERIRDAWADINGGRERWIDGTLKLAAAIADSRDRFPDHRAFSLWLERNGLQQLNKNDRTALLGMAEDLAAARELLTTTTHNGSSWDQIWRKRPNCTLPNPRKGVISRGKRASGHRQRQRAQRIPTVMQEPYQRLQDLVLTREQVDPDFKGTPLEFSTKHGHVPLHTKAEKEENKRQEALQKWMGAATEAARAADALLACALPDPETLAAWLKTPSKVAKYQTWVGTFLHAAERLQSHPAKPKEQIATSRDLLPDGWPDHRSLND